MSPTSRLLLPRGRSVRAMLYHTISVSHMFNTSFPLFLARLVKDYERECVCERLCGRVFSPAAEHQKVTQSPRSQGCWEICKAGLHMRSVAGLKAVINPAAHSGGSVCVCV